MADLPGLIEGASQGLVWEHSSSATSSVHVLSFMLLICPQVRGVDPYEDYLQINKELETYNLRLMERPQIIVANKMDMPEAEET